MRRQISLAVLYAEQKSCGLEGWERGKALKTFSVDG